MCEEWLQDALRDAADSRAAVQSTVHRWHHVLELVNHLNASVAFSLMNGLIATKHTIDRSRLIIPVLD